MSQKVSGKLVDSKTETELFETNLQSFDQSYNSTLIFDR
jgi:hypothetical protein